MAVLVDAAIWPFRGRLWCHLVSDTSYDELHAFAADLGMPRRAFQGDHYDLPSELRSLAVDLGAEDVTGRELILRLKAAGLRRRKQYGDPRVGLRAPVDLRAPADLSVDEPLA